MNPHTPQLSIEVGDKEHGFLGYLCIDRLIRGTAHGGIRIKKELSFDEMKCLSRAMTYKGGLIGFKVGGAKAGIIVKDQSQRNARLAAFGKAISPFIMKKIYIPGMDMGCSQE